MTHGAIGPMYKRGTANQAESKGLTLKTEVLTDRPVYGHTFRQEISSTASPTNQTTY